jgi:hypothetical protein
MLFISTQDAVSTQEMRVQNVCWMTVNPNTWQAPPAAAVLRVSKLGGGGMCCRPGGMSGRQGRREQAPQPRSDVPADVPA